MVGRISRDTVAIMAAVLPLLGGPACAQDADDTRAVRIIEGAPGQPPSGAPALAAPTPPPPVAGFDVRQAVIRTENDAGVALSIQPDVELAVGTKVALRVTTRKQGYLILLDVDPAGRLTQIYPNRHTLERRDNQESLNLIKAAQAVVLPDPRNSYAGFEFVAAPPAGIGMLVAIVSDRPVHLMDLPDVAPPGTGQASFDQISEVARRLRIAREDGSIASEGPRWSFDAKFYRIK
jgi:hypothetical protein